MDAETHVTIFQGGAIAHAAEIQEPLLTLDAWITAWLAEKSERTGSAQTRRAYEAAIVGFRTLLTTAGLDLDSKPALVALCAQGFAGQSAKGRTVAAATFNQRLAILSSFYEYAIKHEVLAHNPILRIDRRPVDHPDAALPLDADDVAQRFAAIDRSTMSGKRDYALLAVAFATGRRVSELASVRWRDLTIKGNRILVTWRCKGAKLCAMNCAGIPPPRS